MCAETDTAILSAGIDIGTTTTQLIFSRLTIKNVGGFGDIPRYYVADKQILYRSAIHFTPLRSETEIDADAVKALIRAEYQKAGIRPEDLSTGAVIITGETSRKQNAQELVRALSDMAGDFVVAAAGPNLESVLAGKGSGAAARSQKTGKLTANIDIGGGTSNICFFQDGHVVDTACFDIGGRLITVDGNRIVRISPKAAMLIDLMAAPLHIGDDVREEACIRKLTLICEEMVRILEQAVMLRPATPGLSLMMTNQLITCGRVPEEITLSGGVADCVRTASTNPFLFGDIGVLLGNAVRDSALLSSRRFAEADETMNATVIGAGNYSMDVSGSTIAYQNCTFPYKNIPVIYVDVEEDRLDLLYDTIRKAIRQFRDESKDSGPLALASRGIACPSFIQIEQMAASIAAAATDAADSAAAEAVSTSAAASAAAASQIQGDRILILIMEADIGKALGQALKRILQPGSPFLCIDGISCGSGDYIDLGTPKASGKVIPVIVKTLIFNA